MNDLWKAAVLGVIEGVTEFLPISSTGHMILAMPLLDISATKPPWNVLLWVSQLGAILAVVVYFFRDLWRRTFRPTDPRARRWDGHILTKLLVAMVPTIVLALAFKSYLDPLEDTQVAVAAALIVGALLMWWIDRRFRRDVPMEIEDVTLRQAALIGVLQCISMWPGVSRSGASIMGGMVLGLSPRVATEFSFYLAIPTMLAAAAYKLWKHRSELSADNATLIAVGSAVAFIVAWVVIAAFLRFVRTQRFTAFVIYRILLGAAVLLWAFGPKMGS